MIYLDSFYLKRAVNGVSATSRVLMILPWNEKTDSVNKTIYITQMTFNRSYFYFNEDYQRGLTRL